MSASILRAARGPSCAFFRSNAATTTGIASVARPLVPLAARSAGTVPSLHTATTAATCSFSTTSRVCSADAHEETFEEFTNRFEKEFEGVQDVFELQRNLNNAFAYDLVPAPSVIKAAIEAARRVNDFPTAVRIFEALRDKTENKNQYEQYLEELKPLREEYGIMLKEELYPNVKK